MNMLLFGRFYHNLVRLEEDVKTQYQIGIDNNINLENLATINVSESKQLKEIKTVLTNTTSVTFYKISHLIRIL